MSSVTTTKSKASDKRILVFLMRVSLPYDRFYGTLLLAVEASEETSGSEDGENSVRSGGKAKRRRVRRSVVQGASLLARTLLSCEEKREKRHREMMELEERRLRIEEDRSEMNRQGFAGLIAAVNSLSGAIHALVSHHHRRHPDPN